MANYFKLSLLLLLFIWAIFATYDPSIGMNYKTGEMLLWFNSNKGRKYVILWKKRKNN